LNQKYESTHSNLGCGNSASHRGQHFAIFAIFVEMDEIENGSRKLRLKSFES